MVFPMESRTIVKRTLFAVCAGLLALVVGFVWPLDISESGSSSFTDWKWPAGGQSSSVSVSPEVLARVWPVIEESQSTGDKDDKAVSMASWLLVAIVSQGGERSALLLAPDLKVHKVTVGMNFDGNKRVESLGQTTLVWQSSDNQQGTMALYPNPIQNEDQVITKP